MQTRSKVVASFQEAVADIPDGSSILIGGFGPGTPHNLIKALYEQGAEGPHAYPQLGRRG